MAQTKRRPTSHPTGRKRTQKRRKVYIYTVLIRPADPDETGYWVEVPALPGCFTQGETVEECLVNVQDAIRCYIDGLLREGQPIPEEPKREGAMVGEVKVELAVPA